jgi:hypothetical protein
MFADPADSTGIGVNGLLTLALKFEQSSVTLIEFLKSLCFCRLHNVYSFFVNARNWTDKGRIHYFGIFFRRAAASFNKAN